MKFFYLIALIAVCAACTLTPQSVDLLVETFPNEEELAGERVDLDYGEYLSSLIVATGDFYVCRAIRAPYFISVYDRDFNLVDTIVKNGQGPNDLSTAMYYGQWSGNKTNPEILLFDDNTNRMLTCTINPFDSLTTVCTLPASENLSPSSIYQLPGDSLLLGINLEIGKASELFTYNKDTKKAKRLPSEFKFDPKMGFYTSQCILGLNSKSDRYCLAYLSMPWFLIYDNEFNLIRKVAVYKEVNSEMVDMNDPENGFSGVKFINDKIVALYRTAKDETKISQLLIFDSEGNPLQKCTINDALSFTTTVDGLYLLTIHHDEEQDVVYLMKRPMPSSLK